MSAWICCSVLEYACHFQAHKLCSNAGTPCEANPFLHLSSDTLKVILNPDFINHGFTKNRKNQQSISEDFFTEFI